MFERLKDKIVKKDTLEQARLAYEAAKQEAREAVFPRTDEPLTIDRLERTLRALRAQDEEIRTERVYSYELDKVGQGLDYEALANEIDVILADIEAKRRALDEANIRYSRCVIDAQAAHAELCRRREAEGLPPPAVFPWGQVNSGTGQTFRERAEQLSSKSPVAFRPNEKIGQLETELERMKAQAERDARERERLEQEAAEREAIRIREHAAMSSPGWNNLVGSPAEIARKAAEETAALAESYAKRILG